VPHSHTHPDGSPALDRSASTRKLSLTLGLVVFYMIAEFIGGLLTNSLALLADAGHMLADAGALGLSLFAVCMTKHTPTAQRTFGYLRAEILAALVNGAALMAVAVFILVEAFQRLRDTPAVMGRTMMAIAVGGLVVNLIGLAILHGARSESLNMGAAWLHVLGDALGSVGAIIAGLLIWSFGWYWADPVAGLLIGTLIIISAWKLVAQSVSVLMEHAPVHIDVDEVRNTMLQVDGVDEVHDLHVWTITTGLESLSAHVCVTGKLPASGVLRTIREKLRSAFGIRHITIQLEPTGFPEHRLEV